MTFGHLILRILISVVLATTGLAIICPDQQSRCPESSTCCQIAGGAYGCCPYESAVCCADKLHCCPSHLTCDVTHARCLSQSGSPFPYAINWEENTIDRQLSMTPLVLGNIPTVTCPDGIQTCPSTYTCCPLHGGGYGCCPMDGGVCCADGIHCCPHDTTCNAARGGCDAKI